MKAFELFPEIREDLHLVEEELQKAVQAPDELLTETSGHLLHAGGKRLRPAFTILAGKFFNYDINKLLPLAVALELIHMATLVHDDVVDASMTRRGIPTVKANWGNQISIYTGDYLFAKALLLIASCNNLDVAKILANVSVEMCQGEIQQIVSTHNPRQHLKDYFYRIKRKTALLISASCQLGAIACGAPKEYVRALTLYGHHLGMAFQITDDILDMIANQQELGKPIGGDLRQGIITIPIIYALEHSPNRQRLVEIIEKKEKSEAEILEAIKLIDESGSFDYSFELAGKYVAKAKKQLAKLPDVPTKETLTTIADFVNYRKY